MECMECNLRPATLHFTQIINGNKKEIHVCELCAQEKGYTNNTDDAFSLHELLTSLFNVSPSTIDVNKQSIFNSLNELSCSSCELTFSEFRKLGKFGCARCYQNFKPKLNAIIRRVHSGNTKHKGKIPKRKGGRLHVKRELSMYREYLQRLIHEENFEEAAVVRDRIKQLELEKEGDSS